MNRYSDYDSFAWFYNKYWGPRSAEQFLPILNRLVLKHLPTKGRILDLCCDTGQLAQALIERGFQVTGVDGSEEMLRFARENASAAEFVLCDARSFRLPTLYDAAVSTFDSLNHVMCLEELTSTFQNVYGTLRGDWLFLFDLNMDEGYKARWRGSFSIVEDDHACVVRNNYRPEEKVGQSNITIFRLDGEWRRSDLTLIQKCYSEEDVRGSLATAGFTDIEVYDAQRDLGLSKGVGRTFFVCCKAETANPDE